MIDDIDVMRNEEWGEWGPCLISWEMKVCECESVFWKYIAPGRTMTMTQAFSRISLLNYYALHNVQ
jgi:hypothetical protein